MLWARGSRVAAAIDQEAKSQHRQSGNDDRDAQALADRLREEADYWLQVQQDRHDIATAFRELGAEKPRTVVVRADAPFSVRTEAKFTGLDVLGQRLIAVVGTGGSSMVSRTADRWEWTLVARDPSSLDAVAEPSDAMFSLLESLDQVKLVLVRGRFEEAEGFGLSSDRRIATCIARQPEHGGSEEPVLKLRLAWR